MTYQAPTQMEECSNVAEFLFQHQKSMNGTGNLRRSEYIQVCLKRIMLANNIVNGSAHDQHATVGK
jgi:hypothetical protein